MDLLSMSREELAAAIKKHTGTGLARLCHCRYLTVFARARELGIEIIRGRPPSAQVAQKNARAIAQLAKGKTYPQIAERDGRSPGRIQQVCRAALDESLRFTLPYLEVVDQLEEDAGPDWVAAEAGLDPEQVKDLKQALAGPLRPLLLRNHALMTSYREGDSVEGLMKRYHLPRYQVLYLLEHLTTPQ